MGEFMNLERGRDIKDTDFLRDFRKWKLSGDGVVGGEYQTWGVEHADGAESLRDGRGESKFGWTCCI
jgi:hypothetical protein